MHQKTGIISFLAATLLLQACHSPANSPSSSSEDDLDYQLRKMYMEGFNSVRSEVEEDLRSVELNIQDVRDNLTNPNLDSSYYAWKLETENKLNSSERTLQTIDFLIDDKYGVPPEFMNRFDQAKEDVQNLRSVADASFEDKKELWEQHQVAKDREFDRILKEHKKQTIINLGKVFHETGAFLLEDLKYYLKGKSQEEVIEFLGRPISTSNGDRIWRYENKVISPITYKYKDLLLEFNAWKRVEDVRDL